MMKTRPSWLTKKAADQKSFLKMEKLLKELALNTVCGEADCPNIGECFQKKTATFMILGKICTRNCGFCAVSKGIPEAIKTEEAASVAIAVNKLNLRHVVITSVTRDDLQDGGAQHFVDTINEIRKHNKNVTIEVLIPDFKGNKKSIQKIINAEPEIINHNLETVPVLYSEIRSGASYTRSLNLLKQVKESNKKIITKTGMMLGLGERGEEVVEVMDDLRNIGCDVLTLGQYLRPTEEHVEVKEYISPEKFNDYKEIAFKKGFKFVESGPFVRSSYQAVNVIEKII
ncbi:Lipoyl synthase [Clostridium formicaceticum]|uniref:Lipoyl synthase n=2 Tax=Clostridium formicaceticum TaxID=1497 RepID=A0AAC9RIL4_9CLOT|nr:Lipoyl synthase [Clostridium formicaceticum]